MMATNSARFAFNSRRSDKLGLLLVWPPTRLPTTVYAGYPIFTRHSSSALYSHRFATSPPTFSTRCSPSQYT